MQQYISRTVTGGAVRGVSHNGVTRFLGVRYGAAPTGERRWRRAQPAEWRGTFDASAYAPLAPQLDTRLTSGGIMPAVLDLLYPRGGSPAESGSVSEDSLALNVWAPDGAEGLPVLVWLHGGGYVHGAGSEQVFAGDQLARSGRAVVVSINHRLGLTGFLSLEHLLGPEWRDSENVGLTDIVLALRWISENIAAFGGDPEKVTVFGQSGGGAKVAALTAIPEAEGLFRGGIIQSGVARWVGSSEEARELTGIVLETAKIPEYDAELLLELPLRYLMHLQGAVAAVGGWRPTAGTSFMPHRPFTRESTPKVPLLVGHATHESTLFFCERPDWARITEEAAAEMLADSHGDRARPALEAATASEGSVQLGLAKEHTEVTFSRSAALVLEQSTGMPAYGYRFDYRTEAASGLLGATHSLDLAFVFGTTRSIPLTGDRPERFAVSDSMQQTWLSFAETLRPGHAGLPEWPAYSIAEPVRMVFGEEPRLERIEPLPEGIHPPASWFDAAAG